MPEELTDHQTDWINDLAHNESLDVVREAISWLEPEELHALRAEVEQSAERMRVILELIQQRGN